MPLTHGLADLSRENEAAVQREVKRVRESTVE